MLAMATCWVAKMPKRADVSEIFCIGTLTVFNMTSVTKSYLGLKPPLPSQVPCVLQRTSHIALTLYVCVYVHMVHTRRTEDNLGWCYSDVPTLFCEIGLSYQDLGLAN